MTEIIYVYESLIQKREEYCVICLRSSIQRKLVKIKQLEEFLTCSKQIFDYTYAHQKICYICEKQVIVALKLQKALTLSRALHELFKHMNMSKKTKADVYKHMNGDKDALSKSFEIDLWERQLEYVRSASVLLQTEVLMLNMAPNETLPGAEAQQDDEVIFITDNDATPKETATESQVSQEMEMSQPVAETGDNTDTTDNAVLQEPEIYIESVVILDEDDPIELVKEETPEDVFIVDDPLPEPDSSMIVSDSSHVLPSPPSPDISILPDLPPHNIPVHHSVFLNTTNHPTGATHSLQILPNMTPLVTLEKFLLQNIQLKKSGSMLLHSIVETNGVVSVPTLSAQILNGQFVKVDNSNVTKPTYIIQTPTLSLLIGTNIYFIVDPVHVMNILKNYDITKQLNIWIVEVPNESARNISSGLLKTNPLNSLTNKMTNNIQQANITNDIEVTNISNNVQVTNNMSNNRQVTNNMSNNRQVTNNMSNNRLVTMANKQSNNLMSNHTEISDLFNILNNSKIHIPNPQPVQSSGNNTQKSVEVSSKSPEVKGIPSENKKRKKDSESMSKETDWEDKIPMDVISFMDATDPNADKQLRSDGPVRNIERSANSLALITDVRSLKETEQATHVLDDRELQSQPKPGKALTVAAGPDRMRRSETTGNIVRSWGRRGLLKTLGRHRK